MCGELVTELIAELKQKKLQKFRLPPLPFKKKKMLLN